MFKVCISEFISTPWNDRLREMIVKALEKETEKFLIDIVSGYPKKNYDIVFLCGIRVLTKRNVDVFKLKKLCKFIIEFGDDIDDQRDLGADLYFFFNPSTKTIHKKKYLPKLIDEIELYPEQTEKLSIYVDHYKHQNLKEAEISRQAIGFVFDQIKNIKKLNIPFDIFFHSENGIEINPKKINLPINESYNCKILDYKEIAQYYRKTHLFFPTHRETQGMLAQEIGLCGGMTILQPWMYPKETHYQFRHFLYDFKNPIDVYKLKEIFIDKDFTEKNRKHVKKYCSNEIFNEIFLKEVNSLIS